MNKALYNYLHKKADQMNVTIIILGNEITLLNPKPRHSIKIEDILITADCEIKSHKKSMNQHGQFKEVFII